MDTVTYSRNGESVMILADSNPSIVMNLDDASVEIEESLIGDKCYLHLRKDNFNVTLTFSDEASLPISNALMNLALVAKGRKPIDLEQFYQDVIDEHDGDDNG